jgi:hypothetical protein
VNNLFLRTLALNSGQQGRFNALLGLEDGKRGGSKRLAASAPRCKSEECTGLRAYNPFSLAELDEENGRLTL